MERRVESGLTLNTLNYFKKMISNSGMKEADIESIQVKLDECLEKLNLENEGDHQNFIDLYEVFLIASEEH